MPTTGMRTLLVTLTDEVKSGAGFSLWNFDLARINPHRLKSVPLKPSHGYQGIKLYSSQKLIAGCQRLNF